MESNKGYVYVMMNPSYNGVVKVGKTTKDPEERAKELSSATGIATPFVVVYKRLFKNCHFAERLAHEILTERGYRVNNNREFFSASIPDAIDIIIQLPDSDDEDVDFPSFDDDNYGNTGSDSLGEEYFNMAEDYYYGNNDKFEDHDMALFYYEKSAELRYDKAYEKLGDIWLEKGNCKRAIQHYQKAVDCYNSVCYAKLGKIFMDEDCASYNMRNANLAWIKYFEYLDRQSENIMKGDEFSAMYIGFDLFSYFSKYLREHIIPENHIEIISKNVFGFISTFDALVELNAKYGNSNTLIDRYIKNDILPYLYSLENKYNTKHASSELSNDVCKAHNYFFGINDCDKDVNKAFEIYMKYLENGNITGFVYTGWCFYEKGAIGKATENWKQYYNAVYDLLVNENNTSLTQKECYIEGFCDMYNFALDNNISHLIHDYYIIATISLGFFEYYGQKLENINTRMETLNDRITEFNFEEDSDDIDVLLKKADIFLEYVNVEKEKDVAIKVYTFVKEKLSELQEKTDGNKIIMCRLDD